MSNLTPMENTIIEQEVKLSELQIEINWLRVNGNRAINIIRGLLATETVEQEKWLKESLEATIDLIKAEHPQETQSC